MNTLKFGNGEWYGKKDTILAYNDENSNFKPLPFSFDRASSATRVNKDGLIETVGSGEPRIDYKDDSKGALLLEPSRVNRIDYSEDFSQWTLVGDSIVKTEEKAFGKDVWRLTETGAGFFGVFRNCQETSLVETTISFLAKENTSNQLNLRYGGANNKNLIVDLSDGSVLGKSSGITEHIKDMGNGWFLVSSTITLLSTSVDVAIYTNSGSIDIIFAQEEQGSYPTSYIPTQGGAVTRNQDSCSDGANEQVINSTEGVLYAEIKGFISQDTTDPNRYITITNGTSNERVALLLGGNNNQLRAIIYSSTQSINLSFTTSLTDVKQYNKLAVKYKSGDYAFFLNGTKIDSSTITNAFSANTLNDLSFDVGGGTQQFRGEVKGLKLYNTALTDQELINLTTI